MKFVEDTSIWLDRLHVPTFIALLAAVSLVRTGVWYIPSIGLSRLVANDPFINPLVNPEHHVMLFHWLGPFTAWLLGVRSPFAFFFYNLGLSIIFILMTGTLLYLGLPLKEFRTALLIFALLPVSATVFFWIGYDGLTLVVMTLTFSFPRRSIWALLTGILLGFQHFEQGLCAGAALLIAIVLTKGSVHSNRPSRLFCFVWLVGVIAGKILLDLLFRYSGIVVNSGEFYWWSHHHLDAPTAFFYRFHLILCSILGLGWLVLFEYIRQEREEAFGFLFGFLSLFPLLLISTDETRTLAITSWPLILVFWLQNGKFLANIAGLDRAWLFLVWLVIPWGWVTVTPTWSVFPYDAVVALHRLFGWFNLPSDLGIWPFR